MRLRNVSACAVSLALAGCAKPPPPPSVTEPPRLAAEDSCATTTPLPPLPAPPVADPFRLTHAAAMMMTVDGGPRAITFLCDLPDAEAGTPLAQLYATSFFALLASCLAPGGLYARHVGSFQMAPPVLDPAAIVSAAAPCFAGVWAYSCFIPSFAAEWVFAVASRDEELPLLTAAEVDARLARRRQRP